MAEVRRTLRKMDIKVELKPLVDDQVLDIWMPVSKAVVCPIGPYGYYAGTTHRTAYSKMHQRILELEGHVCIPVPYFEWAELKTDEDKMVYLWSLGRKAAGGRDRQMDVPSETEPAEVEDWQSDLTDTAAAELWKKQAAGSESHLRDVGIWMPKWPPNFTMWIDKPINSWLTTRDN